MRILDDNYITVQSACLSSGLLLGATEETCKKDKGNGVACRSNGVFNEALIRLSNMDCLIISKARADGWLVYWEEVKELVSKMTSHVKGIQGLGLAYLFPGLAGWTDRCATDTYSRSSGEVTKILPQDQPLEDDKGVS